MSKRFIEVAFISVVAYGFEKSPARHPGRGLNRLFGVRLLSDRHLPELVVPDKGARQKDDLAENRHDQPPCGLVTLKRNDQSEDLA